MGGGEGRRWEEGGRKERGGRRGEEGEGEEGGGGGSISSGRAPIDGKCLPAERELGAGARGRGEAAERRLFSLLGGVEVGGSGLGGGGVCLRAGMRWAGAIGGRGTGCR